MYKLILRVALVICPLTVSIASSQEPLYPAATGAGQAAQVQVLSAGQMSREDADVLAANRDALASAAELNGYDIRSGSWIQNQILCPNAPRHVIVHFLKISPDGSVSLFTAAVPRPGPTPEQLLRVRIVPVLYHGAPAFHVFGSIPSQRELINEVVSARSLISASEPDSDWKTLAFCYAALTGAEPASKSVTAPEEMIPILEKTPDGKVLEMRFNVIGPDHMSQSWRIVFDHQALVKAIFLAARPVQPMQVVQQNAEIKPRTIPEAPSKSHPIPDYLPKSHPIPESH